MNRLRQLLASARSAWAKFDADITVWNRVVHGIGAAEPVQVERRQAARRGFGGRRSTDMFPPLTGDEMKARLQEIGATNV